VANKDVTITSENKEEPLSKAKWIVLNARGFAAEEAARHFGTRLSSILQLAALSSRLGVDTGENKPTTVVNEHFARSSGLIEERSRSVSANAVPNLPDDDVVILGRTRNNRGPFTHTQNSGLSRLKATRTGAGLGLAFFA
jgi:hypothetical protein